MTSRLFLRLALGGLIASAWSCGSIFGPSVRDTRELREARQLWASHGIASYEFVVRSQCFCPYGGVAVRVVVEAGSVQSVTLVETGQPLEPQTAQGYRDIEGLFSLLEDAIDSHPASLNADYDATYGFPRDVFIDYSRNAADEEYGWAIDSFLVRELRS